MKQNKQKYLILDAGPIISLTMNGLLPILEKLKQNFNGEFVITPDVKREVIDKPMTIRKYAFEAIKVKDLLDRGILKLSSEFVSNQLLEEEIKKILNITDNVFYTSEENLKPVHRAEASCLAFSNLCKKENVIVIDERTTRMLSEAPHNMKKLMERKLHTKIKANEKNLQQLKNFKFIRSAELMYIALKKNLFKLKDGKTLVDAVMFGLKFKGTAISSREIEVMKGLVKV